MQVQAMYGFKVLRPGSSAYFEFPVASVVTRSIERRRQKRAEFWDLNKRAAMTGLQVGGMVFAVLFPAFFVLSLLKGM